jgi:hypothetical protein
MVRNVTEVSTGSREIATTISGIAAAAEVSTAERQSSDLVGGFRF